jgi:uncharacterized repeat protein (TIGR03803 family)
VKTLTFCLALIVMSCNLAFGQTYKVLYSFGGMQQGGDGANPWGNLVNDPGGNLYGVTYSGGSQGYGSVFELSPNADGSWTESILHSFCTFDACADGYEPQAGLVIDGAGNLYGTTWVGGSCEYFGTYCGTIFELSRDSDGSWNYSVLYNFCTNQMNNVCLDGATPESQLTFDKAGNLYGTTEAGGINSGGTVFMLSPGTGGWTETVLYNFCSVTTGRRCDDGYKPKGGVTFDNLGSLYGTTQYGGVGGAQAGTVYKLTPGTHGWLQTVLYSFTGLNTEGRPEALVSLVNNNLYTTFTGTFSNGIGGILQLSSKGGGRSTVFNFNGPDGEAPVDELLLYGDSFYGTTSSGGIFGDQYGTIFKINAAGETVLYNFCSQTGCIDGGNPGSNLVKGKSGALYGTAEGGGAFNQGVVFEITP